ncbi:YolD-like protein [Terribacillus halophilus]|uniref:YolD-like protein n=1 Tax=Terribacillus halophilus TaxID=361279 RepID=A0A1G6VCU1_9BACI|nr:YolD-like family protein [Terribacillus halophilus]SDD50655.1 YolD-like protein [Terribacillus halophilus]
MVNDRGKIKWTSLMLPEHVEMLQHMGREIGKAKPPIMDEQQLEELEQKVRDIEVGKTKVRMLYRKGQQVENAFGIVTGLMQSERYLLLDTKDSLYPIRIPFHHIIDISLH